METGFGQKLIRVVVTGPESTGKTNISDFLSRELGAVWIPEYARYYVSSLKEKYTYSDIEHIAGKQIDDYKKYCQSGSGIVIFDTWLIITKVWFEVVYGKYPSWLDAGIRDLPVDLYLICAPDIPWEADDVRENGNAARELLFKRYIEEIGALGTAFKIISGNGRARNLMALKAVNDLKRIRE